MYRYSFFLLLLFYSSHSFGQYGSSGEIDTPAVAIDTFKVTAIDSCMMIKQDSIQILRKEMRLEKAKKTFRFLSYFKYTDPAFHKEFSGVEKYLPYKGKTIRTIQIEIFKPFGSIEDDCSQEINGAQKFGNKIHFISRERFVRQDILFNEGDDVDPSLFADTEKLLWSRDKYKDVRILLISDSLTNTVDILIYLQDRLSWTVGLGYSNRLQFGISTFNFLGAPNTLSVFAGINFNKHNLWAVGGSYRYENIGHSQVNFSVDYLIEKLNKNVQLALYRNFYSIRSRFAFDVKYSYDFSTMSLTRNDRDVTSYIKSRSNYYSIWMAYALPFGRMLKLKDDKLKLLFSSKVDNTLYRLRPFLSNIMYDKIFVQQQNYKFGVGVARWDFYLARNAFYIDVAEYFQRGYSLAFWVGPQIDEVFGRRIFVDVIGNYGMHFKKVGFFYPQAEFSGYINHGKREQLLTSLKLDYVSNRVNMGKLFFYRQVIKAGTDFGSTYPEERYFTINDMVRGFSSPFLKGSKSITLGFESDVFLDKTILLSRGMMYAFCDMGWISENRKKMFTESVYQYGVGFGFRLRSPDLGLPFLDVQFSFYPRGKSFGQGLFGFNAFGYNSNSIQPDNMFYER